LSILPQPQCITGDLGVALHADKDTRPRQRQRASVFGRVLHHAHHHELLRLALS
jgi:hypothetical protein